MVLFFYFVDDLKEMPSSPEPASGGGAHMGLLQIHIRDRLTQIPEQRSPSEHPSGEKRGACPHHVRRVLRQASAKAVASPAYTPPREEDWYRSGEGVLCKCLWSRGRLVQALPGLGESHLIQCWDIEWLSGDPRHHSKGGRVPHLLPAPPHVPWPPDCRDQALHTGRIVHVERWWGSEKASMEWPHHIGPDMERSELLQPCSHFSHLRPQRQSGSTHLRVGDADEHGPGQHDIRTDHTDRPV